MKESINYSISSLENHRKFDMKEIKRNLDSFIKSNFPYLHEEFDGYHTYEYIITDNVKPEDAPIYTFDGEYFVRKIELFFREEDPRLDLKVVLNSIDYNYFQGFIYTAFKKHIWTNPRYGYSYKGVLTDIHLAELLAELTEIIDPETECCDYNWFLKLNESVDYSVNNQRLQKNNSIEKVVEKIKVYLEKNFPAIEESEPMPYNKNGRYYFFRHVRKYNEISYIPGTDNVYYLKDKEYFLQTVKIAYSLEDVEFNIILQSIDNAKIIKSFQFTSNLLEWVVGKTTKSLKHTFNDYSLAVLFANITDCIVPGTDCCQEDWYMQDDEEDMVIESFNDDIVDIVDLSNDSVYDSIDDPREMPRISLIFDLPSKTSIRNHRYPLANVQKAIDAIERMENSTRLDAAHFGLTLYTIDRENRFTRVEPNDLNKVLYLDDIEDITERFIFYRDNKNTGTTKYDLLNFLTVGALHLSFQYNRLKKDNLLYCFRTMVSAMKTLLRMAYNLGSVKKSGDFPVFIDSAEIKTTIQTKPELKYKVEMDIVDDMKCISLLRFHSIISGVADINVCSDFADFLNNFFNPRTKFEAQDVFDIVHNQYEGIDNYILTSLNKLGRGLDNLYKFSYNIDKKKILYITLPEERTSSLTGMNIRKFLTDNKLKGCVLRIDGNFEIDDLDEYSNLSYLDEDYLHNKLSIDTGISPRLMKGILCKASFKTIDLNDADFSTEIYVNLSSPEIKNKDCNIIAPKDKVEINKK